MGLFGRLVKSPSGHTSAIEGITATGPHEAERLLEEGIALEDLGQAEEALKRYEKAIHLKPELARAHFNRGNILLDKGDAAEALGAYALAAKYKPDSAAAHYNMGNAHMRLGNTHEAIAACRNAIALKPDFADAHISLGMALGKLGKWHEAIASYRRAAQIQPASAELHHTLGRVMMESGHGEEAITSFDAALGLRPEYAEAHRSRGIALQDLGRLDEAILAYRRALAINPGFGDVHSSLGAIFQKKGQLDQAIACYRQALDIRPEDAPAHNSLGAALCEHEQYHQALEHFRRAIEIEPGGADGHLNLAITLAVVGQFDAAIASFHRTLEISPNNLDAHLGLSNALKDLGENESALKSIYRALELDPNSALAHNNLLFIHNYVADHPPAILFAHARRFGEMVARLARPYTDWPNSPFPDKCLRVGLMSGDLCAHPVGYFLENVLAALSSQASGRLELFAYPNHEEEDMTSKRLRAHFKDWHCVARLSDEALAQRIRDDGIDILIDLSGHTARNRLPVFAWKPAPVQLSWLGYFATTGVAAIDYLMADPWTLTPEQEAYFSEHIWRLPETRLCFTAPVADVGVSPLPALVNGYVTFGCFNNLSKMNDAVVALWARVLNAVPGARLFLKSQQLSEASVRQSTCKRFAVHGIDPGRLIFEGYVPRANYLASYQRVDIGLDPFPFPGGTTTAEALWMGIPVLTLAGERFLSRQGVGLLVNAGLPEWVATDPGDYVARAVAHAGDLQALTLLRSGLRQQVLASPIFNAPRFAVHFEAALHEMWRTWCATRPVQDESAT